MLGKNRGKVFGDLFAWILWQHSVLEEIIGGVFFLRGSYGITLCWGELVAFFFPGYTVAFCVGGEKMPDI